MGSCFSSPKEEAYAVGAAKDGQARGKAGSPNGAQPAQTRVESKPDFALNDTHEVIKLLGTGGEGETWLCKEKDSGLEVAIKLIKRPIPKPAIAVIKREIKIQADLGQGHNNIVNATEVVLSRTHLGLVMEYVRGGNMVQYVTKRRENKAERGGLCIEEEEARYYFIQLLSAVEYCHKHHVAHRDVKLDNTLLDTSQKPPWIKLCDFGFAKAWAGTSNMNTMRIGTPEYMGPELISSRTGYDGQKVDVWAAGVLLYVMLVGMFPFETQDDNMNNTAGLYDIWLQQIKTSWREVPNNSNAASRLSPDLKDLLDKMFEVKQDQRPDVATIKAHPWFTRELPEKYTKAMEDLTAAQAEKDSLVAQGALHVPERDKQLDVLLEKASTLGLPTETVARVNLTKAGRTSSLPAPMKPLDEE